MGSARTGVHTRARVRRVTGRCGCCDPSCPRVQGFIRRSFSEAQRWQNGPKNQSHSRYPDRKQHCSTLTALCRDSSRPDSLGLGQGGSSPPNALRGSSDLGASLCLRSTWGRLTEDGGPVPVPETCTFLQTAALTLVAKELGPHRKTWKAGHVTGFCSGSVLCF